ncbi:hypothetical protein EON65_28580 [archaeon]|nr:MAG: hypothetical protein EON65_28580 [archaeon]
MTSFCFSVLSLLIVGYLAVIDGQTPEFHLHKTDVPMTDLDYEATQGPGYRIYSPSQEYLKGDGAMTHHHQFISGPEGMIKTLVHNYQDLDGLTIPSDTRNTLDRAQDAYLSFLLSFLQGESYGAAEMAVEQALGKKKLKVIAHDMEKRKKGQEFSYLGKTMAGHLRMMNVKQ